MEIERDDDDDFDSIDIRKNLIDEIDEDEDLLQSSEAENAQGTTQVKDDESNVNQHSERIKVYLRIRPFTEQERSVALDESCISVENEHSVVLLPPRQSHAFRASMYGVSRQQHRFLFNRVFKEDTTQMQFFDEAVKDTITEFVDGQRCLVFSYGVTNSGKTYTMQGDTRQEGAGIIPRSLNQLFTMVSSSQVTGIHFKPIMFGDVARLTAEQIEREEKLKESLFRQPLTGSISNVALNEVGTSGKDAAVSDDTFADCENIMSDDSLESRLSIVSDMKHIGNRMRYTVWVSFLEIYNEQLYDLLVPLPLTNTKPVRRTMLQLRDDREGRPFVLGLRDVNVTCAEEALKLMEIGRRNLHIASTRLNRTSSRSHCIFTLKLVQLVDVDKPSVARVSSLSFCDLAGSERYQASCAFNDRVKEAGNINSSLLTLGRCIEALKRNQSRREQSMSIPATPRGTTELLTQANTPQIRRGDNQTTIAPFRESKLTRIIQNFLCGEGRVSMIVNISQCLNVFDETLHALKYSALAREVIIAPVVPSSLPRQIQSNSAQKTLSKRHTSTSLNISRSVCKKRKTEDLQPIAECLDRKPCGDSEKCTEVAENDLDSGDEYVDAEDTSRESYPAGWKEQRENMIAMIKKLEGLLNEERSNSYAREVRIRQEVCNEMQKQMVRIENDYHEGLRAHEENCEDKYERKMEIYKDALQKSCKRLRPADSAAHSYRSRDLEVHNEELEKQVADLRVNFKTVCDERDSYVQRLTKAEFMASDAARKLEQLQSEAGDILTKVDLTDNSPEVPEKPIDSSTCTRICELEAELSEEREKTTSNIKELKDEIEQLTVKIKDMENIHEFMCEDLRRELTSKQNEIIVKSENEKTTSAELSHCKLELEQMKVNLASAEENLEILQAELVNIKNRLTTTQDEKDKVEEKLKGVDDELAFSRSELVSCKKKYEEDLKETRINLESKLDEALKERREMDCIESEMDKATSKLSAAENKLANCVADLQRAQSDISKKEDELKHLVNELEVAQETSKQQEMLMTELSRKLEDAELQIKSHQDNFAAESAKHLKELQEMKQKFSLEEKGKSKLDAELKTLESELETSARNLASLTSEMSVMKNQILEGDDREQKLKVQFNASAQLVKELQGKIEQISASSEESQATIKQKLQDQYELKINNLEYELSAKEQKLQARYQTINDLVEKMEKEHAAYEIALRDAKSNESVIKQLKLTLSEQELTMQAQDRVINDRDLKVQSLEENITRLHTEYDSVMAQLSADSKRHEIELSRQIESNIGQVKEKDARIKELEKEIKKLERQKLSLEKDVCDLTSELKDCERKLTERTRELSSCQLEVERLKSSKEVDTKSMAKDLIQRGADLLSLKQQLAASEELFKSQCDELDKIREQYDSSKKMLERKEKELKKWRLDRDVVAADLQKLICDKDAQIKLLQETAKSNAKESEELESLKRALNIKHQAIEDLREQNLQLQKMIGENTPSAHSQQTVGSKSKRSRGPLRVTDHNADLSMSILSEGHHAVDLDEGSARSRKIPKKSVGEVALHNENSTEIAAVAKSRRGRHCNVTDEKSVIPESPVAARPAVRELRSRRAV